jgi:hypothetical protein
MAMKYIYIKFRSKGFPKLTDIAIFGTNANISSANPKEEHCRRAQRLSDLPR